MPMIAKRALAWIGWILLGIASLAGVALSLAFLLVSTDVGRDLLVPRLVRAADEALAGRIELESFHLLPEGGIELVGVRVIDPDGDVVLSVARARVLPDLSRLRSRSIGLRVDVEGPVAMLKEEEDGGLSIARAFAPAHPSQTTGPPTGESAWTFRLTRLELHGGDLRYVGASGDVRLAARGVTVEARGEYGQKGARIELKVRGDVAEPVEQPAALDVAASLRESRLEVPLLRVVIGPTAVEIVGSGDVARRAGRAAAVSFAVSADEVKALVPRSPLAGDLSGTLYAESDGALATAALEARPAGGGGTADAAAAVRLGGGLAAGVDLALDRLDPSRLVAAAPPGSVNLALRARAAGTGLNDLRGAVSLSLAKSRIRGAVLGPAELRAAARSGGIDVSRLELTLPGASLRGSGHYRPRAMPSGQLVAEVRDLAELRRGVEAALSTRLPPARGRARVELQLGGEAAPSTVSVSAPALALDRTSLEALVLRAELRGTVRALAGTVEGGIARLAAGDIEARSISLRGRVDGRGGKLAISGMLPRAGGEVVLQAAGSLSPDGTRGTLTELVLGYPGTRFALVAPATVTFAGPSVDRLELVAGEQRIALAGGLSRRELAARAEVAKLDLSRIPQGLLPEGLGLGGRLSLVAEASGPRRRPNASASVRWSDGRILTLEGLETTAEARYSGDARRAGVELAIRRSAGGELDMRGDLPVDLAGARSPLSLHVSARAFPIPEALRLVHSDLPLDGTAGLQVAIGGTVGTPTLSGVVDLAALRYQDLEPAALRVAIEDRGERARLEAVGTYAGARALSLDAELPLELGRLLRDPASTLRALRRARVEAAAQVPGLDLAKLSGRAGVPPRLAGLLRAQLELRGSLDAPRGKGSVELADLAYRGYGGMAARVEVDATDDGLALRGRGTLDGVEVLRTTAALRLAPERLGRREELGRAPIAIAVDVPRRALNRVASGDWALGGTVEATIRVEGSLDVPRGDVRMAGSGLVVRGQPIGALSATVHYAERRGEARVHLAAAGGGTLDAELKLHGDLGRRALATGALADAPAQARLTADRLDLGFLPVVVPDLVRTADGRAGIDLIASGPLTGLVPQGTVSIAAAKIGIAELGDWTDVVVQASLSERTFRLERLAAHRGDGDVTAHAEVTGLGRKGTPAVLTATVQANDLPMSQAGQELATVDLELNAKGELVERDLTADVKIPSAVIRLPGKTPRALQPLEQRRDIVVESGRPKKPRRGAKPAGPAAPLHATVHLLVPNRFFVKSDNPRMNIELKADVTFEYVSDQLLARGQVDTIRGQVEPIGGRNFTIERGRVIFTGGPAEAATLDIAALYENPAAKVEVLVSGPAKHPQIKMSSNPPMDEAQIALLIATGRTELKAGAGGVGSSLTGEEVGKAALGAVATKVFQDVIAGKLPLDTVSLDSSQLRAGKYVTDKIYVGYTRRFNAQPELGENANEVRIEYQITPRWTFQSRYGDYNNGGVDIIWSKDY